MVPVGGIDLWDEAKVTFERNHPGVKFLLADVNQVTLRCIEEEFATKAADIDVVVGGPPCQGFSTVGKRETEDPRNLLWRSFHALVNDVRPSYVVIENVEGLSVMERGGVRDGIIDEFAAIGYQLKASLLRAADYGMPQSFFRPAAVVPVRLFQFAEQDHAKAERAHGPVRNLVRWRTESCAL